jgi:hypothetical protein
MTRLLKKAFDEASQLPEDAQDALAQQLLDEIASEEAWGAALEGSADALAELADEALREHHTGRSRPLDPDSL